MLFAHSVQTLKEIPMARWKPNNLDDVELAWISKEAMEFANVGVYRYTMDGIVVFMDKGTIRLLDLEERYPNPDDVKGEKLSSLFEYLDKPGSFRKAVKDYGHVRNFEYRYQTLTGKERWAYHSSYLVRDHETREEQVQVISQDITALKTTVLALDHSEKRYRALAEHLIQGICLYDAEKKEILFVNQALAEIAAVTEEDLLGPLNNTISGKIHQDDFDQIRREVHETILNDKPSGPFEFRIMQPDDSVRWVSAMYAPIDFDGRSVFQVLFTDITEQKAREDRKLTEQQRMFHAQKLKSLGILAGGIAHDFNNLLTVILGNADLAMISRGDEYAQHDYLGNVKNATMQATKLCQQLLTYAGKRQFTLEKIEIGRMIQDSRQILEVSVAKRATLAFDICQDPLFIQGDSSQLRQILMNGVINASEAINHKDGYILVKTFSAVLDRDQLDKMRHGNDRPGGRYVVLEISDNGSGMKKDTLEQIFDPFFTTKFAGRGLGMASVLGIVQGLGGALKIESEWGKGSCLTVAFPDVVASGDAQEKKEPSLVDWKGEGKVLLADDEPDVLISLTHILQLFGFTVITAENGEKAVEIFDASPDHFKLVILDVTMPKMDGLEACRKIRAQDSTIPILLSSGYSEDDLNTQRQKSGGSGFLPKPYQVADVKEVLISILGK